MSEFTQSLTNVGSATIHKVVLDALNIMLANMSSEIGIQLNVEQSYISEQLLVDELRKLVKYKNKDYSRFFDSSVDIVTLSTDSDYPQFVGYLSGLRNDEFEPPLMDPTSMAEPLSGPITMTQVYSIPSNLNQDPRRSGIILKLGPTNLLHDTSLRWLRNHAFNYGFVFHGPLDKSIWMYNKSLSRGTTIIPNRDSITTLLNYLD